MLKKLVEWFYSEDVEPEENTTSASERLAWRSFVMEARK